MEVALKINITQFLKLSYALRFFHIAAIVWDTCAIAQYCDRVVSRQCTVYFLSKVGKHRPSEKY